MVDSRQNHNTSSEHENLAVLKEDAHNCARPDEVQSSPSWPYVTFDEFTGDPDKSGDNSSVGHGKVKSRRNIVYDDIIGQWKQRVYISDLPKPRPSHARNSGVHAFSTRQYAARKFRVQNFQLQSGIAARGTPTAQRTVRVLLTGRRERVLETVELLEKPRRCRRRKIVDSWARVLGASWWTSQVDKLKCLRRLPSSAASLASAKGKAKSSKLKPPAIGLKTYLPRARSLSGGDLQPDLRSWGKVYINLNDKISPGARSAWREQLLCRELRRLSAVPKMVMARQGGHGSGYRVVSVSPQLSPELAARAVIEGTCGRVSLEPSPLRSTLAEEPLQSSDDMQRGPVAGHGPEVERPRDMAADVTVTTGGGSSFLPMDIPDRGFHLVLLHAVVRNCIEWSHCLPKVEPCFRVSDNRDVVLLGLVHTMGGRLLCSSKHDVHASLEATRRVIPSSSPLPRLLDSHICRSPALLRTSATARVGLFEVDCVDELLRVSAARRCVSQKDDRLHERARRNRHASVHPVPRFGEDTSAALIKLAYPVSHQCQGPEGAELREGDESSSEHTFPALFQAAHGATIADVLEILQVLQKSPRMCQTGGCKVEDPGIIPVVGFSIDLGEACLRDSQLAYSCRVETGTAPSARVTPGEAVESETLARDIEAAVRFVQEIAYRVVEAISSTDTTSEGDINGTSAFSSSNQGDEGDSTACLPPFSFRRLHVTGLGHGGARGEPLIALKTALSRHLSEARLGNVSVTHGVFSRPVIVSADATEHFMAGGVWSTVASVIGRREVALGTRHGGSDGVEVPTTDGERAGGLDSAVMYHIDDGCYGSLSGALLRGVPMHPTALSCGHRDFDRDGEERAPSASVPCSVWGPTCDGFDCVARVTPLPTDLEPGRDWLLFPERGMRGTADATDFNGLPHLDAFYCVHQQ